VQHNLHQRGFASAIRANNGNALPVADVQGYVFKKIGSAVLLGYVVQGNQCAT